MTEAPIGFYQPGSSPLHRIPAGGKMVAMVVGVVAITLLREPWQVGVAAIAAGALYALAGMSWRTAAAQLWPMRWLIVLIGALQLWLADWRTAVLICGGLLVSVSLAALVTLTTRVTALLDLCVRVLGPLRRYGVDPDRVGLVLAMTIRCVPLMVGVVGEVNQARRARGVGFSPVALAAPVMVRTLRTAEAMGDALVARGVDD